MAERNIKHVVAVASGKGGVGKSSVTVLTALGLARRGYRVGIMDADITGPSIPRMFGMEGFPEKDEAGFILPRVSREGIRIISTNLLLEDATQPVLWKGPIVGKMVGQFWSDVSWGELDFLLVDMPPGTGDVPLTVFQSLPLDGVLMVTSPQDLAGMVVGKAIRMAEKMDKPVLGLVENMSYLICPGCEEPYELFGSSHAGELAEKFSLPLLGKLPVDPAQAELSDQGRMDDYVVPEEMGPVLDAVEKLTGR